MARSRCTEVLFLMRTAVTWGPGAGPGFPANQLKAGDREKKVKSERGLFPGLKEPSEMVPKGSTNKTDLCHFEGYLKILSAAGGSCEGPPIAFETTLEVPVFRARAAHLEGRPSVASMRSPRRGKFNLASAVCMLPAGWCTEHGRADEDAGRKGGSGGSRWWFPQAF
jgi:hypothetical protein